VVLTVSDTATALCVSERTVWRLIGLGELSVVKIGRAVRVTRASVEAFLARGGTQR
jgi:excisionase family DNA binding protein